MIQLLLHNLKMDPLVSLHYYAPVCAFINCLFLPVTEGLAPFYALKEIGFAVMFSNASVALLLNVAAVFLVGVASGLVLTLAGVFKVRRPILTFQLLSALHLLNATDEIWSFQGVLISATFLSGCDMRPSPPGTFCGCIYYPRWIN